MLGSSEVDRLLTLFAPCMLAFRKRTNDDLDLFVVVSGHEHRTPAPDPTIGTRTVKVEHGRTFGSVGEWRM